jgi:tetratricopeptide (TPR) repeat protein
MKLNFKVFFLSVVLIWMNLQFVNGQKETAGSLSDQDYLYAFSEATRFYLFGNYVQAVTLYKECLRIRPQSSAVHYQLSKVFLGAGNVPLAREHAKKATLYEPDNKWYIQQLGDIYQMEQKYDSAVITYKKLLKQEHNEVSVLFGISALYEKTGKYSEALLYLDSIDYQIGNSREVLLARYRILESQNKPDLAIIYLKSANQLYDNDFTVPGMLAEFYRKRNMPDSASKYYKEIYPEFSNEPVVVFSYADFLLETNKADSARSILIKAMSDTSIDVMSKAGYFYNVLRDEKQIIKARVVLDTIAEVFYNSHREDIRTLSIYSDVQIRLRNFNKAANALRIITQKDPSNYAAVEQLVFALNATGKTDSVLYYSGRAIQQFKDRPLLYLFNGSAHYQKGSWENAINSLTNGLSLTGDTALRVEFYSLLAECYQNIQKYDESENAFNEALKLDRSNLVVKNNYAYYLSLREKNLKLAEKMSLETIKAQPSNSTYLDTYAWILFKQGKYRKAEKYILSAVKQGGNDEDILKHCAEIQIKLGKYAEAIKYLSRIVNMGDSKDTESIKKQINDLQNKNQVSK